MISNEILEKAILFAAKKHTGQSRKGNKVPYIMHPMGVASIIYETKKSSNINLILAICFLHDVVEDCNVSIKEIARIFGFHIAGCVEELTTNKEECEKLGKQEYLLRKMVKMTSYSLCVKLADRLHNLRDMGTMSKAFKENSTRQTEHILDGLKRNRNKLSATHIALIELIRIELKKHCQHINTQTEFMGGSEYCTRCNDCGITID